MAEGERAVLGVVRPGVGLVREEAGRAPVRVGVAGKVHATTRRVERPGEDAVDVAVVHVFRPVVGEEHAP